LQVSNIINGWLNYFNDTEIDQNRLNACIECKFAIDKKYLTFVKDDFKEIKGKVCDKCDCPLSAKLRSKDEKCPINKW
jgi:hypothetical protein